MFSRHQYQNWRIRHVEITIRVMVRSDRLIAAWEIITNFTIRAFSEETLNISDILHDSNILENTLIELKPAELSSANGAVTRALKSGKDLREIINKARALGQYRAMTNELATFRNVVTYSGSSLIILITLIIIIIIWKVPAKRGAPLLTKMRLFSDLNPCKSPTVSQGHKGQVYYSSTTGRVFSLPNLDIIDAPDRSALRLSRVQRQKKGNQSIGPMA